MNFRTLSDDELISLTRDAGSERERELAERLELALEAQVACYECDAKLVCPECDPAPCAECAERSDFEHEKRADQQQAVDEQRAERQAAQTTPALAG